MQDYHAGFVQDYAEGDRKVIVCGDTEVGVFRLGGEFYAWHNRCAHQAGPVCQGRVFKRVLEIADADGCVRMQEYDETESHIVCPWHGYEFSIKTGQHPGKPSVRLRKANLTIQDGTIYVTV
jgi:nitrite reductase/ring-hydroxylating ferredoxin subunit